MTGQQQADGALLERRRRRTLNTLLVCFALPLLGWPLAVWIGHDGDENREAVAGAILLAGLLALGTVPFVLGAWRRFMARTLLETLIAGEPDLHHIDGEADQHGAARSLASPAFDLGSFDATGLTEAFKGARISHVVHGESQGVPFALAELRLVNAEGFEVFRGVLGSFRLQRTYPGLTVVARERGMLGNLIASMGSVLERIALEDPRFERRFEAYGSDQVWSRTVLTASMLERLLQLDQLAHAEGFRCAFADDHLLLALPGMRWHCAWWRVLLPLDGWLANYRRWLGELIALPGAIVRELALDEQIPAVTPLPRRQEAGSWDVIGDSATVMRGPFFRLVAGLGMPAAYIASGLLFGGISLFFGAAVLEAGIAASGGWATVWPIPLGLLYGVVAIGRGTAALLRLAWTWNAPLRSVRQVEEH